MRRDRAAGVRACFYNTTLLAMTVAISAQIIIIKAIF